MSDATRDSLPVLAITMGDVNGVGPEVLVKALAHADVLAHYRPFVVGSAPVYEQARAQFAPGAPPAVPVDHVPHPWPAAGVPVFAAETEAPPVRFGTLDAAAGAAAVAWLEAAIALVQAGAADALVTCPINKEGIHRAGYHYQGHTDLIAERCGTTEWRMCLFAGPLRAVHLTGHLSLREAIDAITTERIVASVRIADAGLRRLGMVRPRIAVAGLNPHAGESGAFGDEEAREVAPAIAQCRDEGYDCAGPVSPDAVFRHMADGLYDVVIALYHDQGHIPLKLIAMDSGVNVTLGIPIVRTSVDHGTAYDIAGQGLAREDSMLAALRLAAQFAATPATPHV